MFIKMLFLIIFSFLIGWRIWREFFRTKPILSEEEYQRLENYADNNNLSYGEVYAASDENFHPLKDVSIILISILGIIFVFIS